jgi:hypothetical protein
MRIDSKNSAMLWGLVLIALGSFFFLQATGILGVLSSLVWTLIFAAGASVFLYLFLTGLHERWWAAIPGFTLMGLAAVIFYDNFAPPFFSDIGGAIFPGVDRPWFPGDLLHEPPSLVGGDPRRCADVACGGGGGQPVRRLDQPRQRVVHRPGA